MKRLVLTAILAHLPAAVLSQAASSVSSPRDTSAQVVVSERVRNNIDFFYFAVAKRAGLEAVFCIGGSVDSLSKTAHLRDLRLTSIDSASGENAFFRIDGCKDPDVIGTLHFHRGIGFCQLSGDDINSAHDLAWPITAIVCVERPDEEPKLVVVHREVFDAQYEALPKENRVAKGSNSSPAIYRYRRHRE